VTPDGAKVYVALQSSSVAVIDTSDDSFSTVALAGAFSTYGVAVVPGADLAYVSDESNDAVWVLETSGDTAVSAPSLADGFVTPRAMAAVGAAVPVETTTTTAPATTTTVPATTTTVPATTTTVPATTTTTVAEAAPSGYELPRTGRSYALAGFGMLLLALGAGLSLVASRSRTRHPAR